MAPLEKDSLDIVDPFQWRKKVIICNTHFGALELVDVNMGKTLAAAVKALS